MIVLSGTNHKIQIVLGGAASANQVQFHASYRDLVTSPSVTYIPGSSEVLTSNATDIDAVAAPASGAVRMIPYMNGYNADTSTVTLTIKKDVGGTETILWKGPLLAGERVEYTAEKGFDRYTAENERYGIGTTGATGAAGTNGTNGALTVSEVEIDFGATPVFNKVFTVTDSGVIASSKIIATQSGDAATDRDADENEMDFLILNCSPSSGQFTLNAIAIPGPVSGKYKINYQFS